MRIPSSLVLNLLVDNMIPVQANSLLTQALQHHSHLCGCLEKESCWKKSSDNNSQQFVKSSVWHCTAYVRLLFPGKWPTAECRRGILAPTCFSAVCHHHIFAAYGGGGNSSAQGPLYFGQLVTAWQMMSYSFYVSRMRTVVCVFQSHRVSAWKLERHLGVYCWIWGACCITRILSLCAETTVDWINSRSVNWHEGEQHSRAILSQAHTAGSSVRKQKLKML